MAHDVYLYADDAKCFKIIRNKEDNTKYLTKKQ